MPGNTLKSCNLTINPILIVQASMRYHAGMSRQLTIRGVPDDVAGKLRRLSEERGNSVNTTVLDILRQAVGTDARRERLARYATWTPEDLAEVEGAVAAQRVVDDSVWQ
jgi:plasmid stability protein